MSTLSAMDKISTNAPNGISNDTLGPNREQTVSITDVISEGPIYGLVHGEASIFLNNNRIVPLEQSSVYMGRLASTVTITNGSTSAIINLNGQDVDILDPLVGSKFIYVRKVKSSPATLTTRADGSYTLTTSSSFFTADMASSSFSSNSPILTHGTRSIPGTIEYISAMQVRVYNAYGYDDQYEKPVATEASYPTTVHVDYPLAIASISGTTITLASPATIPSGVYQFDITSGIVQDNTQQVVQSTNFHSVTTQFRVGNLHQAVLASPNGIGNTVIPGSVGATPLEFGNPPTVLVGTDTVAGFGLTSAQVKQVDEIRLIIQYPNGLYAIESGEKGDSENSTFAFYKIEIAIRRNGTFGPYIVLADERIHGNRSGYGYKGAISFEEVINLEPYFPMEDFRVRITRTRRHDGTALTYNGENTSSRYTQVADSIISSVSSVIKEPLTYPYTAVANVTFSSKHFTSVPSRMYHCRGMLVKVPSNYITREESPTGVASYNGLWDGTFREGVYTNNPAWVFYDIITNKRYGLGQWISEEDVDKYSLYSVAQYCDELVPDGRGGQEPRFTANVYLTKAADCYKVLKDLATIFRGILYFLDGQLVAVQDKPSDPVYNFSKANVIDGVFTYENTGSKTRSNQIIVTWNNPAANYRLEPLLVEDREDIIRTGRVVTEEAVAYGAVTEGQALRYGRWKLWTARNQTELVSFKTALNAAFLGPGDIINIQDADRFSLQYSGRIPKNSGTVTASEIALDREITLYPGSVYELSVMLDPKTVETRTVVTAAGQVTSLEVDTPFSSIPPRGMIWALKEVTSENMLVSGSVKAYKILTITEEDKHIYAITAVEHYNEKFDAVDNEFTAYIEDSIYIPARSIKEPPAPRNVYITKELSSRANENRIVLRWTPPESAVFANSNYEYTLGYEIQHPFYEFENPFYVDKNRTSVAVNNVPAGTYEVAIRTISSNNTKSKAVTVKFKVAEGPDVDVPIAYGLPLGGVISQPLSLSKDGLFEVGYYAYSFSPAGAPLYSYRNLTNISTQYKQDVSDLPAVDYASLASPLERQLASGYIMFDYSDTVDPWKLIKYKIDDPSNIGYWYDAGTGNADYTTNFVSKAGTVSVSGVVVTGVGTSFLTDYVEDSIIKFGGADSAVAAKIAYIESDTKMYLQVPLTVSAGSTHFAQKLIIDPKYDALVSQIQNDTVDGFRKYDTIKVVPDYGTYAALATIGLDPPLDPELYVSLNPRDSTAKIRIKGRYVNNTGLRPEMLMLMYSTAERPNAITLGADEGTRLRLASVGIQGNFICSVLSGSTRKSIVYTPGAQVIDINLSGMWWVSVQGTGGNTSYYKISKATSNTLYLEEELPFTPANGDQIHIIEIDFADQRVPEFKYVYVGNEVIKHDGIGYDSGYYLKVVERGAEGTTQANQTGKVCHYYPAFGALTNVVVIPIEEFEFDNDEYTYNGSIPVVVEPNAKWVSVTCCLAKKATEGDAFKYVRSNIVPLTVMGPV